jgi:hypothetical protein
MTPTIQGLTVKQKLIADLLWTCNTQEQMQGLIQSLPTDRDKIEAAGIARIMVYECMEDDLDLYESEAADLINQVKRP